MQAQYAAHPTWSYALHYKNLDALVAADSHLGPLPSYPTLHRALKARGLSRRRRSTDHKAEHGPREVRNFEMPHAHALWHLDFHHGKRNVMRAHGTLVVPKLLAVLDDHSRVCCHAQWYVEGIASTRARLAARGEHVEALRSRRVTESSVRGHERTTLRLISRGDQCCAELQRVGSGQCMNAECALGALAHRIDGFHFGPGS
jgi:hypothetical protein